MLPLQQEEMPVDKITHQSGFSQRTERDAWLRLYGAQQGSRGSIELNRLHVAIKNRIGFSPCLLYTSDAADE